MTELLFRRIYIDLDVEFIAGLDEYAAQNNITRKDLIERILYYVCRSLEKNKKEN